MQRMGNDEKSEIEYDGIKGIKKPITYRRL
jgi:hypothetical protein